MQNGIFSTGGCQIDSEHARLSSIRHLRNTHRAVLISGVDRVRPTLQVFVQGDCWSNNILYDKLSNGEAGDELVALIDWQVTAGGVHTNTRRETQICHPGSPFEDFCKLLTIATSAEVRRKEWPRVFDVYYDQLRESLKSYGHELQPTREQMWEVWEVRARPDFHKKVPILAAQCVEILRVRHLFRA